MGQNLSLVTAASRTPSSSIATQWPAGRSDLVSLALRLIVEEALEGEVADVLGRERYERGDGEKAGHRNGYRPGKVTRFESRIRRRR